MFVIYLTLWQLCDRTFITEIFKPLLLSSNTLHLHTTLTKLLLTQLPALLCLLHGNVNSLMNILEGKCCINVYIIVPWLSCVYFVYIYSCSRTICICNTFPAYIFTVANNTKRFKSSVRIHGSIFFSSHNIFS